MKTKTNNTFFLFSFYRNSGFSTVFNFNKTLLVLLFSLLVYFSAASVVKSDDLSLGNFTIDQPIQSPFIAGSTQTIIASFDITRSISDKYIINLTIANSYDTPSVWKGDFQVSGLLVVKPYSSQSRLEYILNCLEINNGTFYCYNTTLFNNPLTPSHNTIYLNITSNPCLYPGNYIFNLNISVVSQIPNEISNETNKSTEGNQSTTKKETSSSSKVGGVILPPYIKVGVINPITVIAQTANSTVTYEVNVTNEGTATGNFSLYMVGLPKSYYLTSEPVEIKPGRYGILYYTLKLPFDAENTTFTVLINATNGELKDYTSYNVTLIVLPPPLSYNNTTITNINNATNKTNVTPTPKSENNAVTGLIAFLGSENGKKILCYSVGFFVGLVVSLVVKLVFKARKRKPLII